MHVLFAGITPHRRSLVKMHTHTVWEINYYFIGSGIITMGDNVIEFQPKDIICQPPNIPHSKYSEDGFRNIFIHIADFISPFQDMPRFKDNNSKDFYNIIMQLYREFHIKQNNWKGIVDHLLGVLYQYMIAWNYIPQKNPLVEEFEGVLVSNIANTNFKINQYMNQIPMSSDHFRKLFKKETGQTPIEYLINRRIDYAKQLLDSRYMSTMRVKEIAAMTGFDDPYYFSRLFKKITGKSPTIWEKDS